MQQKQLSKDEKKYLYARLLYPERFWKIANAYVNKRKSLPPRRQLEKLNALVAIEDARIKFLGLFSLQLLTHFVVRMKFLENLSKELL